MISRGYNIEFDKKKYREQYFLCKLERNLLFEWNAKK